MSTRATLKNEFFMQFKELHDSIIQLGLTFPEEVIFELVCAISHLVYAQAKNNNYSPDIDKAISHVKRAHFDLYKIKLLEIAQWGDPEFLRLHSMVRLYDLKYEVSEHNGSQNDFKRVVVQLGLDNVAWSQVNQKPIYIYRELLKKYSPLDIINNKTQEHVDSIPPLTPQDYKLLWEWIQLETILASVALERTIDHYELLLNIIFNSKHMSSDLQKACLALKIGIYNKVKSLFNLANPVDLIGSTKETQNILTNSDQINKCFCEACKTLGITLMSSDCIQ